MLLITHDLGIVAETCDDVAIMYAGEIVEIGSLERIFHNPRHPYTLGLFGSIPSLDKDVRRLNPIPGLMPDPADLPSGCKFRARCAHARADCAHEVTELRETEPGHFVRCLRDAWGDI
jgi:peptide/nickel transport system ATP-binding protein